MTESFISDYVADIKEGQNTIDDAFIPLEMLYPVRKFLT